MTEGYLRGEISSNTCLFKTSKMGWRDGSAVKSTDSFAEGPEFKSHQQNGGS